MIAGAVPAPLPALLSLLPVALSGGDIALQVWVNSSRTDDFFYEADTSEMRGKFRLAADWVLRWMESHGVTTSNVYVYWGDRQYQWQRGEQWLGQ